LLLDAAASSTPTALGSKFIIQYWRPLIIVDIHFRLADIENLNVMQLLRYS